MHGAVDETPSPAESKEVVPRPAEMPRLYVI